MNKTITFEQRDGTARLEIPMRLRERLWLAAAATAMFLFGAGMSVVATYMLKHTNSVGAFWWLPLIFTLVVVLLYVVGMAIIWAIPPTILAYDGNALFVGDDLDERRTTLQRPAVRALQVSRLPMVPIGSITILTTSDPPRRVGYWKNRELLEAVQQLRAVMGLRK